jgi:hypothetical protein
MFTSIFISSKTNKLHFSEIADSWSISHCIGHAERGQQPEQTLPRLRHGIKQRHERVRPMASKKLSIYSVGNFST